MFYTTLAEREGFPDAARSPLPTNAGVGGTGFSSLRAMPGFKIETG